MAGEYASALKVAVCEYLLSVNRSHEGPFIPPTAIDWLGNGIVSAILPIPNQRVGVIIGVNGMVTEKQAYEVIDRLQDAFGGNVHFAVTPNAHSIAFTYEARDDDDG